MRGLRSAESAPTFIEAEESFSEALSKPAFSLFGVESTDNSCGGQILFCKTSYVVELGLNALIFGHSKRKYECQKPRNDQSRRNEDKREFDIDYHCHNDCAHCDKRRTQNKADKHKHRLLSLVDVAGHSRDERSGGKLVEFGVSKRVDVRVKVATEIRAETHRRS